MHKIPSRWRPFARRRFQEEQERQRRAAIQVAFVEFNTRQIAARKTVMSIGTITQDGYQGGMDPALVQLLRSLP